MIETRKRSTILNLVVAAIILLIAFLFWPNGTKYTQSNKTDRTKTQIKILLKRINIRKDADIESEDIGDVYRGEIYTVLSHIDHKDFYWYHIKTENGIEGYIGSDPNDEYVKVISGFIDREAPKINVEKEPIILVNGKNNLDQITCTDDHTNCSLSYEEKSNDTLLFKAIDDDENVSTLEVKYYKVYDLISEFRDNSENINAIFNKTKTNDYYIISANYKLNKTISKNYKSDNYNPVITFYDENFEEINNILVWYNTQDLGGSCINDYNNTLKEEYKDIDLLKGNSLCINYKFNKDDRIKYLALGFQGVENYDNNSNILANYFSKYFILES